MKRILQEILNKIRGVSKEESERADLIKSIRLNTSHQDFKELKPILPTCSNYALEIIRYMLVQGFTANEIKEGYEQIEVLCGNTNMDCWDVLNVIRNDTI